MALSTQDVEKGMDFTGLTSANASQHNQLVDLAVPKSDSATEGKGLVIWTVDSALDTPIVPDAATTTKWKRYTWVRVPYTGAAIKTPILYGWNDDTTSIATYLKWLPITADLSDIEADIAQLQIDIDAVEVTAASAQTAAAAAQTIANTALNTANDAQEDATAALALAAEEPAEGSITADMLAPSLDLSTKNIILPSNSVTAAMLTTVLDLSAKTLTLPAATIENIIETNQQTSNNLTIPGAGNAVSYAHNLNAVPRNFRWVFVCTADSEGYLEDMEMPVTQIGTSGGYPELTVYADANTAYFRRNSSASSFLMVNGTTGAAATMTEANWKLKCYVN